jgi:threonine synthase
MKEAPVTWQVCIVCATEWQEQFPATRCAACGGLLELRHRPPDVRGMALRERLDRNRGEDSGVWKFRELVLPGATAPVSYPEGNTPLLFLPALAGWAGVSSLHLKHEGQNPTGSFKDRGMTVGVTQACRIGARGLVCASTGNTSASLAAYGARAGLPVYVLIPSGKIALGKLAQTVGFGARVLAVQGDFDTCFRLVEESSQHLGLYLLNSINPFRIEGQKTIVFELLQQLRWEVPDWIVLPGGNLGNTAAFGKALREALELELIDRLPRLAVVQAEGAAPFYRSFTGGFQHRYEVEADTVATAIRIGNPASWERAVAALRESNGVVVAVSDAEILEAKRVIDRAGVGCEPASAASLAGLRRLVADGTIPPDARVGAVLTGHMLKDPEALLGDRSAVHEIEPRLDAIQSAIFR